MGCGWTQYGVMGANIGEGTKNKVDQKKKKDLNALKK